MSITMSPTEPVRNKNRPIKNKQSKIPVLKTDRKPRKLMKQTSLVLEKKESDDKQDVFNLEELLCDIQDTIEKQHPTNFMEEMKEIIAAKDQLYQQLDSMKSEQRILQENQEQERNKHVQENCQLKQKLEESNGLADEITLKLEEESCKARSLEIELRESKVETDLLKESFGITHKPMLRQSGGGWVLVVYRQPSRQFIKLRWKKN